MVKVIRDFKERYQGMRLYNVGDEYQYDDEKRVQYLISQGFLEEVDLQNELPNAEQFAGLSAAEQKQILSGLGIEGDDSNAEKREALYTAYLEEVNANDPGA